jgi:hypothetical protein
MRLCRACLLSVAPTLVLALCACLPADAGAQPGAKINARFTPERLGAATTVSLGFQLPARDGRSPAALSSMQLAYPANLGLATSGLGLASCSPSELEALGGAGCPANSRMGFGSATVELALKVEIVTEHIALELFAGPSPDGYLHVLVYASGVFPVYAQVLLSGVLLRGQLSITVPPIPSFPEAPDVVMTQMQLTLGGHLTYYERVAGKRVAYHPAGVGLPSRCPSGGFPFAATFVFLDGGQLSAHTAVPCPSAAA